MGSATIYSTDIVGLKAYRLQDEYATDSSEEADDMFAAAATQRIMDMLNYLDPDDGQPALTAQVEKDIEKGRYFYNIILKRLEEKFDENNKELLKEYIVLYEKMYSKSERNSFKYYLAYACFENHYCEYVVGLHYEAGDGVEMDIEKAKAYFKKAYEGGCEIAYGKYHEYFEQGTKKKVDKVLVIRYIQLLELNEDTDITEEDITSSYRALSKIYHPDIANSRYKDGKKFNELKKARDYLLEYIEDVNSIRKDYFYEA